MQDTVTLTKNVRRLRDELALAEQALKDDIERRRAAIDEEAEQMGFAARQTRQKATGRVCGACGERGHTARGCAKKKAA